MLGSIFILAFALNRILTLNLDLILIYKQPLHSFPEEEKDIFYKQRMNP